MAISTDRFRVKSIRPAAHVMERGEAEVPTELQDKLKEAIVTAGDLRDGKLDEAGLQVKSYNLHHGGGGLVELFWNGQEYVLDLEPMPEQVS